MDPHATTELITATAAAAAVARLFYLNLVKRLPALFAYLAFVGLIDLGFGLLDTRSAIYFWAYLVLEPVKCVLGIVAVRELLILTFHNYPGIRSLGRWIMYGGIGIALTFSLLLTGFFWGGSAQGRAHSHRFYLDVSQRSVIFTLALVILAILLFLSRYPLQLSRNILVSGTFFSILFLSEASQLLLDSLAPKLYNLYVDWAQSIFVSICLVAWATLLVPEVERARTRVRFTTSQEDQLLEQLHSLNHIMTRAARR
jgi:hypothetical protein